MNFISRKLHITHGYSRDDRGATVYIPFIGLVAKIPPCFGKNVKPSVLAAFAVVSIHSNYDFYGQFFLFIFIFMKTSSPPVAVIE
jgi:hypothetical protein